MTLALLVAVVIGLSIAFQPVTNAVAAQQVGVGPIMVFSNAVVLGLSVLYAVFVPGKVAWASLPGLRPDLLLGGALYGAAIVFGGLYAFPRLGAAYTLSIIVLSQFACGLIIDHFGWYEMAVQPISFSRIAGVGLVLGGAFLLRP